MARKSIKYTEDLYTVVENLILAGNTQAQVAQVLGIAPNTFSQHIAKDQRLKTIVETSVKKIIGQITASVIKKALGYTEYLEHKNAEGKVTKITTRSYPPDMLAASIYLNNRDPENWKAKREDDKGKGDKLVIHVTLDGKNADEFKSRLSDGQSKRKDIKAIEEADYVIDNNDKTD